VAIVATTRPATPQFCCICDQVVTTSQMLALRTSTHSGQAAQVAAAAVAIPAAMERRTHPRGQCIQGALVIHCVVCSCAWRSLLALSTSALLAQSQPITSIVLLRHTTTCRCTRAAMPRGSDELHIARLQSLTNPMLSTSTDMTRNKPHIQEATQTKQVRPCFQGHVALACTCCHMRFVASHTVHSHLMMNWAGRRSAVVLCTRCGLHAGAVVAREL